MKIKSLKLLYRILIFVTHFWFIIQNHQFKGYVAFESSLFELFKFKPKEIDFDDILLENNLDYIMDKFSWTLQKYGLFFFYKRLLDGLFLLSYSIFNSENSPSVLDKYKIIQGTNINEIIPVTKYIHLTFSYFFL